MLSHYQEIKIAHFGLLLSSYVQTGLRSIALRLQTLVSEGPCFVLTQECKNSCRNSDPQIQIEVENILSN